MKTNNAKNNNRPTKPVLKILPVYMSGVIANDREYNIDSCQKILADLQNNGVFSKLSISVTMAKSICVGDVTARGVMSVARIQSYDEKSGEMSIMFFSKNVEYAKLITDDMVIIPRVRTGRDSVDVSTILGFEIVTKE